MVAPINIHCFTNVMLLFFVEELTSEIFVFLLFNSIALVDNAQWEWKIKRNNDKNIYRLEFV